MVRNDIIWMVTLITLNLKVLARALAGNFFLWGGDILAGFVPLIEFTKCYIYLPLCFWSPTKSMWLVLTMDYDHYFDMKFLFP